MIFVGLSTPFFGSEVSMGGTFISESRKSWGGRFVAPVSGIRLACFIMERVVNYTLEN